MVGERQLALVEALDEVSFSLVLAAAGGLTGPALPCEGHEPALVPGILEGRVIVLQHNLGEHAVFALPPGLPGGRKERRGVCLPTLAGVSALWACVIGPGREPQRLGAQECLPGEVGTLDGEAKVEGGTNFDEVGSELKHNLVL